MTPPHRKFKKNAPAWYEERDEQQRKAHSSWRIRVEHGQIEHGQIDTDCADPHLPHPIRRRLELCRASREKIIQAHGAAAGRPDGEDSR
ncbi:hypothetical protein [Streptomyces cyaneus]|uniref:hypothetical protein n=1 Tax=Streptomyces cyaneus TaxID=1904 RepID=UPI001FE5179B|nr:hypothetical protein [Streptomyces cyaneus]